MSADNWTTCPKCRLRNQAAMEQLRRQVNAAYGVLSVAEFDALRDRYVAGIPLEETFREDYGFYIDEHGVLDVSYRGSCMNENCDAVLEFHTEALMDLGGPK